jgi:hypothetical protein
MSRSSKVMSASRFVAAVAVLGGFMTAVAGRAPALPATTSPMPPLTVVGPLSTGPACLIQSDFISPGSTHGNFEVVVLQGHQVVDYFHDNFDPLFPWRRGQVITDHATGLGPGCLIQSDFKAPGSTHGNFEVVIQEGTNLVHYFHNNSNVGLPWQQGQTIATGVSGPGSIIQSDFKSGASTHGNFEVVAPRGGNLVHYFHNNSNVGLPWQQGQTIATGVSGPGSIIQSDFKSGASTHGNFEVIAPSGIPRLASGEVIDPPGTVDHQLVHWYHDNSDVLSAWRQAQQIAQRGRSNKVCQVTGNIDKQTGAPLTNEVGPHPVATDLGFPVERGKNLTFLFGDSRPMPPGGWTPYLETTPDDAIATTADASPPGPGQCPTLTFNASNGRFASPVVHPQIDQGLFNVPTSAVDQQGTLYGFFWTNHCWDWPAQKKDTATQPPTCVGGPNSNPDATWLGRGVVARSDDNGANFQYLGDLDPRFAYTASLDSGTAAGVPPTQRLGVLVWGVPSYRLSIPRLAIAPAGTIGDKSTWRYFSGLNASGQPRWLDASNATPVRWNDAPDEHGLFGGGDEGCVGEFNVTWNTPLQRWLMLYNCAVPDTAERPPTTTGSGPTCLTYNEPNGPCFFGEIRARVASNPWGPWSAPTTIFDPSFDHGFCQYIYLQPTPDLRCNTVLEGGGPPAPCPPPKLLPNPTPKCPPTDDTTNWDFQSNLFATGGDYAPYVISRFNSGDIHAASIYYLMSTWNPYEVVLMHTTLRRTDAAT